VEEPVRGRRLNELHGASTVGEDQMSIVESFKKRNTSAGGGPKQESPTAKRVHSEAMIAAKNKRADRKSKWQMPEDFSAKDFDFVRVRTLSSLI
jgi:hypothetical protein